MIGIYARISTEEQSKYSISDQLRQGRKKADTDDVIEYVDEGVSGEFLDRPALSRMRRDVREGIITKVICLDPDRLSRKLMNQLIVSEEIEKRAKLEFVNGEYARTPEGMLFYQMRGAVAEFEKAKINERMSRGRKEKAEQGKVVRDYQVYGYDYDQETSQMVINEEEAPTVRLIFDLFATPNTIASGINGVAKYLTEKEVPTKKGRGVWHRQVVRQILMNRAYVGEFFQNRWNTEGMLGNPHRLPEDKIPIRERPKEDWITVPCPTLIDKEQFEFTQRMLGESRRRWAKKGLRQYLLSGIIRCGECGNTMTGRNAKNWNKHVMEYSDIKKTAGAKFKGCGMKIRCDVIEQRVWEKVLNWLNNPDEIAATQEDVDNTMEEMERNRLEKELEQTKEGRTRLLRLFAGGQDIGEDEIRSMLRDLKEKEERITDKLKEMKNQDQGKQHGQLAENQIRLAAEWYLTLNQDDLTFEDKQELIRSVVFEVRIYKDRFDIVGV